MKPFLLRAALLPVLIFSGLLQAEETTWYRIHSRWYQNEWLGEDAGRAVCRPGEGDAFLWGVEKGTLKNKATGHVLEAAGKEIARCVSADATEPTQRWEVETVSGPWKAFRSNAGGYLNIEHRLGGPSSDVDRKPTDQDVWSAQWEMVYAEGPRPPREHPQKMVSVTSPDYGGDVQGKTEIKVIAPQLKEIIATTWLAGKKVELAKFAVDAEGKGGFLLDAAKFPRGPLTLRLTGTNGQDTDVCFLQLYHAEGKSAAATGGAAPPGAKGLKKIFADEFDTLPAISSDGKGATYAAHKPGGGDFSGIPFTDPTGPNNPFSQRDGLLRIRADELKNSTGLISSLRMDGTGITAKAPCYFECRFTAGSATGTWPAFWLMTADTWKGMKEPVDELDVIEAYGGEGPGNPNFPGYEATTHYWNQGPDGGKDTTQPGIHTQVKMTSLPGLSGSSWYEEFHTYGVRIGLDDTIYYCDGVEVGRHPSGRISRERPFFFFVNLAIGGISGWKKDLSRYGGISDMYVDYVRIYGE